MLITREVDYAIRIVRNLNEQDYKNINEIAEKEMITHTIAHKVARILHNKGVILSKRGLEGGYKLDKSLDEITLFDVYVAMVDKPAINECLLPDKPCPINARQGCGVHRELKRIQDILFEELKKTPLSHMVNTPQEDIVEEIITMEENTNS